MEKELRILILEDVPTDAELVKHELKKGGILFTSRIVETKEGFLRELNEFTPDIILSDYKMPQFDGMTALSLTKEFAPNIPFIIVTGSMNEETAVECMKAGAVDYVIKDHLARVSLAVKGALRNKQVREDKERLQEALWTSAREWRTTFDALNYPVALIDLDRNIRRCNKAMANLLGKPFDEIIGRNCCELMHSKSGPIEGCPFERIRETRKRETLLLTLKERWFNIVVDPVFDENNNFVGAVHIMSDITESKRAEMALRESEKRYRQVIENATEIIYSVDTKGNFTYGNPASLKATGFSLEELRQYNYQDLIVPEHRERLTGIYIKQFRERQATTYVEFPFFNKSGEIIWFGQNASLVIEDGKVMGFHIIARDITERKRAEEALRKSEERFKKQFDEALDAIFIANAETGILLDCNRAACELVGREKSELIGRHQRDLHPPGKTEEEFSRTFKQHIQEKEGEVLEAQVITKKGEIKEVVIKANLIELGDQKVLQGIFHDITERKKAEEALRESEMKFQELFDGAPVGYHELDMGGRVIQVNQTELTMLGYTIEEMLGQPVWKFIVEEESQEALMAKITGASPPGRQFERTYRRKDGTILAVLIEDRLLKNAGGEITGIRSIIQDITERKKVEEEKAVLQEQLRQSQKIEAIGRLAGGIAHDFNNLLTVIKGYSQLSLIELKEDVPLRGNVEEIKRAADRAADLTRQLLAFSRRQILEMKVLDLNTVLRDVDKMLHRLIGEDIELITLLADDLGRVKTDPGWVEQIIMNLAVNARDAMPSVGKLTIETANVELDQVYARGHISVEPGRYVMLSVSDTGVGMTEEVRDRVFEPFFTTKEKGKGTGLGLSTVYGIVKQSEGNIWVYSEPGKGTTFKIYLPRVDEPLEEIKERVVKEELPRGSETILIVEDEEDVLKLASRILERQGYTVLQTSSTSKAFEICKERTKPIHLILTDVVMPQMSGRELVERCREIRGDFKILFMSGYTDNAITHHGVLEKGMNYLQKPFTVDGLARKVREVLNK